MWELNAKQIVEMLFLEGTQFSRMEESFLAMANHIDIFVFLNAPERVYRTQIPSIDPAESVCLLQCRSDQGQFCMREARRAKEHWIRYWVQEGGKDRAGHCDFSLHLKSEVEIVSEQTKSRNVIRVTISRFWEPSSHSSVLQPLISLGSGTFVFKKNLTAFRSPHELEYPCTRTTPITQQSPNQQNNQKIALCLNQSNLRELPFFVAAMEQIAQSAKVTKIIGHPSSLFLALLINPDGKCDTGMRDSILRYKQVGEPSGVRLQVVTPEEIVKSILLRAFSEQNLLNPTLTQFLVDSIVTEEFLSDFVKLVQLYYQIFLKEQASREEVETAIQHYFYQDQQTLQRHAFAFTSLFSFLEWRHNLECNRLLENFRRVAGTRELEELTLLDLYNYNGVEFTFIGLDLTDRTVRFFNATTTPGMPIVALLSLVQFLPTPYKSIYWREAWGRYRIHHGHTARELNISNHEIVDTRFLLESPLDIVDSQATRQCYMQQEEGEAIHAVTSARRKARELPELEELKTLLKSMKSKAIDAIPKLKLIWKILTTKNRTDLDLNNFETFHQIPLISRFVSLDETFKTYLDNFNREANRHRTVTSIVPIFPTPILEVEKMVSNLNSFYRILSEFLKVDGLAERTLEQFERELEALSKQANQFAVKSYEVYISILSKLRHIIEAYQLQEKYRYRAQLHSIADIINSHSQAVNSQTADKVIEEVLSSLASARLRLNTHNQADINSSTFLRDTYSPINSLQRVSEKLISLLTDLKGQIRTFKRLTQDKQRQQLSAEYEKIVYRFCRTLLKAFGRVSPDMRVQQFYIDIYKLTPMLFQLQRMQAAETATRQRLSELPTANLHLVLSGQPHTLLPLAHHLLLLRDNQITDITATNHHSIAAVLFALGIDDDSFREELIGLEHLVRTHILDDEQADLVEMLLRAEQRDDHGEEEREDSEELYLRIAKKYQSAFKLLIQLEDTTRRTKRLNIHRLYQLINDYDTQQESETSLKEQEIVSFLQALLEEERQWLGKAEAVVENTEMIGEKMKLNKVGIRFMIRLLYRSRERQANWLPIHLRRHKSLALLRAHLRRLLTRYGLAPDLTLQEFNSTNNTHIHLHFVLINYHRNRLDTFSSAQRGNTKLLDLLLAAVSLPLDYSTTMMAVREMNSTEKITMAVRKANGKFTESFRDEAYWSNCGCNSLPFNILTQDQQQPDTHYYALEFVDESALRTSAIPVKRESLGVVEGSESNLRAVDILSMWWTKSKKLSAQMKEILFGSIFDSPFLYYYYILQNSSYEALQTARPTRNIVSLLPHPALTVKGSIVGHFITRNQADVAVLRVFRNANEVEVEVVIVGSSLELKMDGHPEFLREGQEYKLQSPSIFNFQLYRFAQTHLLQNYVNFTLEMDKSRAQYLVLDASNGVTLSQISVSEDKLSFHPLDCQIKAVSMRLAERGCCDRQGEGSTCSTCQRGEEKAKRSSLKVQLVAHESAKSDFQQFKCKVIEEVRQSVVVLTKKESAPRRSFLCFTCCFSQTHQS